jgi:hypothetical protein
MTGTRTDRPIPLALTFLIATFSALVALALSGGHDAHAHGTADHVTAAAGSVSKQELALRTEMRRLWEDHVTWTRVAIISLTSGSPDTSASVGRLLRNQTDIGNAIKPFYGRAAGTELTRLLREHITVAADVIAAAKAGDGAKLASAQAAWQANADRIAAFLNVANPDAWKLGAMRSMLREHLRLTTAEAVARLQGDWDADVRAYDRIHLQALGMADMLSAGIVRQFPQRFR